MNDTDWKSLMSSEVFRGFATLELKKEAKQEAEKEVLKKEMMLKFNTLQRKIKLNPELKKSFAKLQETFLTNHEYREKVHPLFVQGVLLLDLD